ncbi:unannotated protein [freshwater metagenome]|uniref:Unannotated protein n=1 Tax=freshwater metagenome TaxID=449393 RepID=A0A6J7S3J4_9ZZZZ
MHAPFVMVECDDTVTEQQPCVRQRRAVSQCRAAFAAQLVAEVAGEATDETERQLRALCAEPLQLGRAVIKDRRLLFSDAAVAALHANALRGAVGGDDLTERPVRRGDEREACKTRFRARAVKPNCVLAVAVALLKDELRLAPLAKPQVMNGDLRTRLWRYRCRRRVAWHWRRPLDSRQRQLAEVLDQLKPILGADRFGVELNPPKWPLAMLEPHHNAAAAARDHSQLLRHLAHHKRVVTDRHERLRQPLEQSFLLMLHRTQSAMKELTRVVDLAAVDMRQRLVSEADAENRDSRLVERGERDPHVAGPLRTPRAGRDYDVVELLTGNEVAPAGFVVTDD